MQAVKKRILFRIQEYQHSEYGALYACSLSFPLGYFVTKDGVETPTWSDDISNILYLAKVKNLKTRNMKMKIIADFHCTANRFAYGSKPIEPFGDLIETREFQA